MTKNVMPSAADFEAWTQEDEEKALAFIRQMSAKFTDDTDYVEREIAQALDHTLIFTLTPEHITGKLVNEA